MNNLTPSGSTLKLMIALMMLAIPLSASAAVIHVPKDYARIKDAVYAAQDGDEIIVSPGVYNERVSFGKNVIVRSTYDGDWAIVHNTIIDSSSVHANVIGFSGVEPSSCVLRGFTIRNGLGGILGNGTHATIEYCIFQNNRNVHGLFNVMEAGGAIYSCDGLIQYNIFENNQANRGGAIANCHGTIQNNLFYQNATFYGTGSGGFGIPQGVINECAGGALYNCNGIIRNNTIVDNYNNTSRGLQPGALAKCQGTIVNNIIAHTTMTAAVEFDQCAEPAYCLFRAPRAGVSNLAGDPQFVNPAQGDYRLQAGSPAIDAGKRFEDLKEDLEGHQRGLKNSSGAVRGDGSHTDIGAYEALPSPVAVWLPHGGPTGLTDGQTLSVSWRLEPPAGATIRLRLYKAGRFIYEFGKITAATGAATTPVRLPAAMLASGSDYTIQGASVANPALSADTARFTITRRNGAGRAWALY